jgi:hypothetical protein
MGKSNRRDGSGLASNKAFRRELNGGRFLSASEFELRIGAIGGQFFLMKEAPQQTQIIQDPGSTRQLPLQFLQIVLNHAKRVDTAVFHLICC